MNDFEEFLKSIPEEDRDGVIKLFEGHPLDSLKYIKEYYESSYMKIWEKLWKALDEYKSEVCTNHHWMYRGEYLEGRFICERCGKIK